MSETRYDFFKVNVPKFDEPTKDANGWLTVDSTPTRAGVFMYKDSLGNEWGELRHEDDVFSQTTLDSLKNVPYTTQENHVELFTPRNARGKIYGATLNDVARIDEHARVSIKVMDESEITAIEGKNDLELSAGYRCDVVNESGTYKGQKYQKRQKNILYNHVARVTNARGGETCRIRLDSNSAICGIEAERIDLDDVSVKPNGESIMKMRQLELLKVEVGDFRLDADEVEFPDEFKGVVDQLKKREKSLVKAFKESQEKLDSTTEESKKFDAKISILEKENKDLKNELEKSTPAEKLDEAVEERAKHISFAKDYGVDEKLSNEGIRKEIVKKSDKIPEDKLDDQTWIDVAFGMLDHEQEKKKAAAKDNYDNHKLDLDDDEESEFDKARRNKGA